MRRTALVIALLATTALAATAAGQGTDRTLIEPNVSLDGSTIEAGEGTLLLSDGSGIIRIPDATGLVNIWTKTVTCVDQSEDTCLPSTASQSPRNIELDEGSIVLTPNKNRSPAAMLGGEASTLSTLNAETSHLAVQEDNRTAFSVDDPDAPSRYATWVLPSGIRATSSSGTDGDLEGPMRIRAFDTAVTVRSEEGEEEIYAGWEWNQLSNNMWERELNLVDIEIVGTASVIWDGSVAHTSAPPVAVTAGTAELQVLEGELADEHGPGQLTLEDAAFTVTGATESQAGEPALSIEQGVPAPEPLPQEDEISGTVLVGAGAAAMAAIAATGYYWPRLTWGATALALPMYSRIEKDELFENEVRETLYELIQDDPGIHAHALSESADVGWGTTVYHLRRLERNGFVTSERRGRYRRFFPAAGFLARQREVLSVLQNETTNDIARLILREPGLNQSAICDELDISPSLANWHINRLLDADLVERERRGRTVHYTPGEAWTDVEDALDPDFQDAIEGVTA